MCRDLNWDLKAQRTTGFTLAPLAHTHAPAHVHARAPEAGGTSACEAYRRWWAPGGRCRRGGCWLARTGNIPGGRYLDGGRKEKKTSKREDEKKTKRILLSVMTLKQKSDQLLLKKTTLIYSLIFKHRWVLFSSGILSRNTSKNTCFYQSFCLKPF